jgi:hypothetical protein
MPILPPGSREGPFDATVRANLRFYARTLQGERVRLRFPAPEGFWSSSVAATDKGVLNVRCIDYFIEPNGSYRRFPGPRPDSQLQVDLSAVLQEHSCSSDEVVAGPPTARLLVPGPGGHQARERSRVHGNDLTVAVRGTAGGEPYGRRPVRPSPRIRSRPSSQDRMWREIGFPCPTGICLYRWHPLEVGTVERGALVVRSSHSTPAWWRHLRGSAPPFEAGGKTLALAHLVSDSAPRNYYSVLVELEPASWRPKAASLPFVFSGDIEYCLSAQRFGDEVTSSSRTGTGSRSSSRRAHGQTASPPQPVKTLVTRTQRGSGESTSSSNLQWAALQPVAKAKSAATT